VRIDALQDGGFSLRSKPTAARLEEKTMKKLVSLIFALAMVLALSACGQSAAPAQEAAQSSGVASQSVQTESAEASEAVSQSGEAEGSSEGAGMANPWTVVDTAAAAAEGAGVGSFQLPEDMTETSGGPVGWTEFQYMEGIAEAYGGIGAAELTARKGLAQDGEDVSGDYTEYAYQWTQDVNGIQVSCSGNEEGKTMKGVWTANDYSYSIMVRGQGDIYDTYGIDADAVQLLVETIQ
jgi:hypothetical protein